MSNIPRLRYDISNIIKAWIPNIYYHTIVPTLPLKKPHVSEGLKGLGQKYLQYFDVGELLWHTRCGRRRGYLVSSNSHWLCNQHESAAFHPRCMIPAALAQYNGQRGLGNDGGGFLIMIYGLWDLQFQLESRGMGGDGMHLGLLMAIFFTSSHARWAM
jgi:hypothetical protein